MFKQLIFLALTFAFLAHARKPSWFQLDNYTFEQYVTDFRKGYTAGSSEYAARKAVFEAKLEDIRKHNANPNNSYKRGVNHMSDFHSHEYGRLLGHVKAPRNMLGSAMLASPANVDVSSLPDSVDWRKEGVVTAVKDQGRCGSCWAFATTETIESHVAISTGLLMDLSPQQVAACTPNPHQCGGTGGCNGATTELGFDYVSKNGIASEWTYSYSAYWGETGNCTYNNTQGHTPAKAKISGYVQLPENDYASLMHAVATKGPIAVTVDASKWSDYEEGVFDGCDISNVDLDHAVQLVGYGVDPTHGPYWLIRNSWTPSWGEGGYIRLKRHTNELVCGIDKNPHDGTACVPGPSEVKACGTCGVLYDSAYPTGATLA